MDQETRDELQIVQSSMREAAVKHAEAAADVRNLCRKFERFLDVGGIRCQEHRGQLESLQSFKREIEEGKQATQVKHESELDLQRIRWDRLDKDWETEKRWRRGIAAGVIVSVIMMALQAIIRWPLG